MNEYLTTDEAASLVADPGAFKRMVDDGVIACRIIGGKRVIHIDALESLTDDGKPAQKRNGSFPTVCRYGESTSAGFASEP
ncbi:helix-turn-helix domain-containing protein [Ectothiorhodospira lacustris]|uniref:helix-turn-helix domain-containing protein n=1 Tax=Ectothiorhodospira lacustris TaxID=2899127 RepID=UPI001EE7D75B|nr:helix-turn-helix domain-containing protein [Ectothiorhodospira lacustris]MCG5509629.1 helix-turn-helix domain-containing protein [Ectothiorhodospira lacustris]MCG5521576.1 helix-turn-helix domain-containing protein [Ectothiorhodospira lacustris]